MNVLVALVLAQSMNLNNQPLLCMDEGAYCRADRLRAFELNCTGTGVTCSQTGGRMTINATGGGSTPSVTCASDEALTWNGAAWSCISKIRASWASDAGITAQTLLNNPADCTAGQYATTIAANGDLTCAQVAYSQVSGTPTIPTDISGASYITRTTEANLSNETALSGLSTGILVNTTGTGSLSVKSANTCTNQFPRSDTASGVWTCASIATADLPTVTVGKGGTGQTTITTNQVYVGTALDTLTAKTLPSCSNNTTDKLLFDNATQTWSCGTDQGGAGSGLSFAEVAAANLAGAF